MNMLKCLRYLPLIAVLLAAVGIAFICMGQGRDYSDSTFVFSAAGQV